MTHLLALARQSVAGLLVLLALTAVLGVGYPLAVTAAAVLAGDRADRAVPRALEEVRADAGELLLARLGDEVGGIRGGEPPPGDELRRRVDEEDVVGLLEDGARGADVDGVTTSGWGHVHTIYRDPTNDYAGSVEQQAASGGMGGGPSAP